MGDGEQGGKMEESILYRKLQLDPERRGDRTRFEIISATVGVIAKEGVAEVTYGVIAERLSTNRAHIKYHFGTIDALILEAAKYVYIEAQECTIARLKQATT